MALPTEYKDVVQQGCTIYSLQGFPSDSNSVQLEKALEELRAKYKDGKGNGGGEYGRCLICSLNTYQRKARAVLEECGFRVIALTLSAHHGSGHAASKAAAFDKWVKTGCPDTKEWETIWLMGRGFVENNLLPPLAAAVPVEPPAPKKVKWGR